MVRFLCFLLFASLIARAEEVGLTEAVTAQKLKAELAGNGRDSASLKLANLTAAPVTLNIPAGTILLSANGERQITLRALKTELAAKAEADAILPTAALSAKNTDVQRAVTIAPAREEKLAKLVELLDKQNDLPRPTGQLAVLVLLEDVSWADWQQWLGPAWTREKPPKPHPTPVEIAQAVDAIALARISTPDRALTILTDDNFKRLALRNPWARGKAMALYGLTVEDAITGVPSLPPDLGKLLHTSPNDNCPICRRRAEMQKDNGL
jgi:hypothetical protein